MSTVRIVTDSTADIPAGLAEELGITVVPLQVRFGNEVYRDGVDLTSDAFYERLPRSAVVPQTSQPSVGAFEAEYERLSRETDQILSVHISSSLSGTFGSALIARDQFRSRCAIEVLDSRQVSCGLGLIAIKCARLAQQGANLREVANLAQRMISNVHILFVVDTLEYLQKGGRIGRAQAFLGSLLNIKPVLKIEEGEVRPSEKVRTRTKALDRLVEFVELFAETGEIEDLVVVHAKTPSDVELLIKRVERTVPRERIFASQFGPVVGTHTGPGTIGVVVSQRVEP